MLAAVSEASQRDPKRFTSRSGASGLREDLVEQLVLMGHASPSYRRTIEELDGVLASPEGTSIREAFERVWQKRTFEGPYERPLLILAALRCDARAEGPSHPLHAAVGASTPDAGAVTRASLLGALGPDRLGFWITLRSRRVQTNEVTRSLAWQWPALLAGAGGRARPVELFDVGASAGLNLVGDALDLRWTRSSGDALQMAQDLDVRRRLGFDPRPLDVRRADDRDWLEACVWPEQRERIVNLKAAIEAFVRADPRPEIVLSRASSVPSRIELETKAGGTLAIAYQSLVRDYVPVEERDAYESSMRAWLSSGRRGERVWSMLELERTDAPDASCALDVHVATGGGFECVRLGITSYHPRVVDVADGAEARLRELLAIG